MNSKFKFTVNKIQGLLTQKSVLSETKIPKERAQYTFHSNLLTKIDFYTENYFFSKNLNSGKFNNSIYLNKMNH